MCFFISFNFWIQYYDNFICNDTSIEFYLKSSRETGSYLPVKPELKVITFYYDYSTFTGWILTYTQTVPFANMYLKSHERLAS